MSIIFSIGVGIGLGLDFDLAGSILRPKQPKTAHENQSKDGVVVIISELLCFIFNRVQSGEKVGDIVTKCDAFYDEKTVMEEKAKF